MQRSLQQSVYSAKDSFKDLSEAIEYMELREVSKSVELVKVATLADFLKIDRKYDFQYGFSHEMNIYSNLSSYCNDVCVFFLLLPVTTPQF